jgi:hypothetical protein
MKSRSSSVKKTAFKNERGGKTSNIHQSALRFTSARHPITDAGGWKAEGRTEQARATDSAVVVMEQVKVETL